MLQYVTTACMCVYASLWRAECLPPSSYYLTSETLEREECGWNVWGESCFTLHWIESSTCILAPWTLFSGCMRAVWRVEGGVDYDLERPSVPVKPPTLSSPNQSNTVSPAPPGSRRDLLENATDSLKSSGEITTLFTRPHGTCAKSSSCTSLCTGPLRAEGWTGVWMRRVCMNGVLTDVLKQCVQAAIYDPG